MTYLAITGACAESIDRQLCRILDDTRLDPAVLLRMLLRSVAQQFLAPLTTTAADVHQYLRLALDETTFTTTMSSPSA